MVKEKSRRMGKKMVTKKICRAKFMNYLLPKQFIERRLSFIFANSIS